MPTLWEVREKSESNDFQLAQASLVAHHKIHRRVVALDELGEVERLVKDEDAAVERVAHLQLGVFGFFNDELLVAKIAERAATVGHPRHFDAVASLQLIGFDVGREHLVRIAFMADALHEAVPVVKTEKTRQDLQRAVAGLIGTVDIAPQAFQGGGTHRLMSAIPHGTAEEDEVIGRLHLTFQAFFDAFLEFANLGTGLLHKVCKFRLCKETNFL